MQLDKQTENNIRITFRNIIEKTCFIDKLRSITGVIKDRFSEHDPRDTDKITRVKSCSDPVHKKGLYSANT